MTPSNTLLIHGVERSKTDSLGRLLAPNESDLVSFWENYGDTLMLNDLGQPQVFFHGTKSTFEVFKQTKGTISTIFGSETVDRSGFFFTQDHSFAQSFAGSNGFVKEVYLKSCELLDLRNGFLNDDIALLSQHGISERYMLNLYPGDAWEAFDGENGEYLTHAMKLCGYDSAVIVEPDDLGKLVNSYIVFSPESIVLAQPHYQTSYSVNTSFYLC